MTEGDSRGDCLQLWRDDAAAILKLPDANRYELVDALLSWFVNGDSPKIADAILSWFVSQLVQKQEKAAAAFTRKREAQSRGGRDAMRRRWDKSDKLVITSDKLVSNRNETETEHNETKTKTETEPKPRAPAREPASVSASVSFSDSVDSVFGSASADALERITTDELIRRAADAIGDSKPSTSRWRDFIERQGKAAFCRLVGEVCERMRTGSIDNGGKYLNALLNKYGQPEAAPPTPAPPAAPKSRTWTRADWRHCEERCWHFDASMFRVGQRPCLWCNTPPEHATPRRSPEECPFYKPLDKQPAAPPMPSIAELAKGIAKPATGCGT
ncbi:MAG: hypothetical protein IJI36_11970 [Kiritimatiellae bacterium]|nr:hypothetical protein [Kiritimatiellia bacterium]